jgi:thiol:disulfide interchange protein
MKTMTRLLAITLFVTRFGLCLCSAAETSDSKPATPAIAPVYTVDIYDPKRNPEDDLKMTVEKATAENKRILIQVGGDWCGWCKLMNKYFHENEKVAAALAKDYLIMKVNYGRENMNQKFLSKYPKSEGYPHIYVLDSDGKFLHSQGTAVLEQDKGYNEKAVLDFLARWAPKKGR